MFSVSQKEKIFFTEHLSLMIKGGIPLNEAIETLKEETKSSTFKKALTKILSRILEGQKLSESFSLFPRIFDKFFCSVVKVGEESGTLEESLKYLARHLRSDYEMKKKVKGALIYPTIIIIVALIVALGVTFFVLPKILDIFQLLEIELPLATRILIKGTYFLRKNFLFFIAGIIIFLFILKLLQKINFFKFLSDKIVLSLPFIGGIIKNINLARFCRTFFTLLKSGVPILETIEISIDTNLNEVFRKRLKQVKQRVEQGQKISQGLKEAKIFPAVFAEMVLIGEKSGTLEESFLYLANFYEREVDYTLKNLAGILEPILLILVGLFVAFVALAIIIPIYKFVGALRPR
jgi:type IV pilus assembly protein PilC